MKKNILVMALMALITTSCSTTLTDELPEAKFATLFFSVRSPELNNMTRAVVDAKDVLKTVDLALYSADKDGNLTLYKSVSLDVSNSEPCALSLSDVAYGTYQVLAVGNASSYGGHANLDDVKDIAYENGMVPVTYRVYQQLVVNASTQNIPLVLEPTVASFRIYMNGAVPSGVTALKFEATGAANRFNGVTGLAESAQVTTYTHEIAVPADRVGTVNLNSRMNLFLTALDLSSGNSDVSIKVSALGSDGDVLYTQSFQKVPLKIGCITTYTGNFFQDDELGFTIQVDNTWGSLTGNY